MKLKQLQEKRGSLVKQARELLDLASTENRALTGEEMTKLTGLEAEVDALNATIDAEMRQIAREGQKITLSKQEERDVERFDYNKILRHLERNLKGQPSQLDGIEAEMIMEGEREARNSQVEITGLAIPAIIAARQYRDLSVTGGTTTQYGGTLVATEKRGLVGDFYNASVLAQAGALVLTGAVGNIDLPRYTKATNPTKKAENASADELSPTFASLSLSPNRLPAVIDVSDQLFNQTGDFLEAFLGREIRSQLLDIQEVAFFHGGGTLEPVGIAGTSGIGSVAGGTNGLAPAWSHIVDLESAVADVNAASGVMRYFTNTKVRGKLKKTALVSSTDSEFVWDRKTPEAPLNGYACSVTNAVSSTLTKGTSSGVASAIFFGDASNYVICYWGGIMLEMVRDRTGAIAGQRSLVANTYYDGGLLRPKTFAAMLDALTA